MTSLSQCQAFNALLAMPASLRLVLVGVPARMRSNTTCLSSATVRYYASKTNRKGDVSKVAAFTLPEFQTAGRLADVPHEQLFATASSSSTSSLPVVAGLHSFFCNNRPELYDIKTDFYELFKNTRLPEVCVLGRSNVGKSSFINGLAHMTKASIAHVSKKAGKTKTLSIYGFGPPQKSQDTQDTPDIENTFSKVGYKPISQAALKAAASNEKLPLHHSLFLVDVPGYGLNSLQEWGDNIKLYLEKRTNLKGVILLIDSIVGPKKTDIDILRMLCSLELKTAIVLTKADKAGYWINRLRLTVREIGQQIRRIESENVDKKWSWERDIYVSAPRAKETELAHSTLGTARLAVARVAGLAKDNRSQADRDRRWTGNIVSFENLGFSAMAGTSTATPEVQMESTSSKAPEQAPLQINRVASNSLPSNIASKNNPFYRLEQAVKKDYDIRSGVGRRIQPKSFGLGSIRETRPKTLHRWFHSTTALPKSKKPSGNRLFDPLPYETEFDSQRSNQRMTDDMFGSYIRELKSSRTRGNHARNVRDGQDRKQKTPTQPFKLDSKNHQRLRAIFAEDTQRTKIIQEARLSGKQIQSPSQQEDAFFGAPRKADNSFMTADAFKNMMFATPSKKTGGSSRSAGSSKNMMKSGAPPGKTDDSFMTADAFKDIMASDLQPKKSKKRKSDPSPVKEMEMLNEPSKKNGKGKKGKKTKPTVKIVDPFEAKFGETFSMESEKKKVVWKSSF